MVYLDAYFDIIAKKTYMLWIKWSPEMEILILNNLLIVAVPGNCKHIISSYFNEVNEIVL